MAHVRTFRVVESESDSVSCSTYTAATSTTATYTATALIRHSHVLALPQLFVVKGSNPNASNDLRYSDTFSGRGGLSTEYILLDRGSFW